MNRRVRATGLRAGTVFVVFVVLACVSGCGTTRLQTARTVPRGATLTTVGVGVVHNADRNLGGGVSAIPVDFMVRHGATDSVDWGVRTFFGLGFLGDVKWNVLGPERKTALALSAGLGAAATPSLDADWGTVVHVPVTLTVSRDVRPWLTPYAAVGYGAYWIFGYGVADRDPGQSYAPRTWTGDGLLMVHAGVELRRASGRAVLLEYAYAHPVVDDPGDFYGFAASHFFSVAFRGAPGPAFSR